MFHTRVDRIYYITELTQHDFSSAQAIIDFFKTREYSSRNYGK
jgi:hypothetical protein